MKHTSLHTLGWLIILAGILFSTPGCKSRKSAKQIIPPPPTVNEEIPNGEGEPQEFAYYPLQYNKKPEMRAVWLTTIYGLDWPKTRGYYHQDMVKQRNELIAILERLKIANFNTVFLQVRLRGDVIYPYGKEPQSSIFTGSKYQSPNYDPLAFAIEECHKRGIALHAWLVTYPLGSNYQVNSLGNRSIVSTHPQWVVYHMGEYYLNPGIPEVRTYIASIAGEIARRYDVDGIHLDYVRYPESAGRFKDRATYNKYAKRNETLNEWRENNITDQIKQVADSVRKNRPYSLISAAPLGRYREIPGKRQTGWTCIGSVYQNPKKWFLQGIVDFVVPMMYYKDRYFDPYLLDWKSQMGKDAVVIPGLGAYRTQDKSKWDVSVIKNQMDMVEKEGFKGICFYREENIRPGRSELFSIISNAFEMPVRPLPFHKKNSIIPPMPMFTSCRIEGNNLYLTWDLPRGEKGFTYNLFFNIYDNDGNPGDDYLLAASMRNNGYVVPLNIFPKKRKVHFRIEAANRNNETGKASVPLVVNLRTHSFE